MKNPLLSIALVLRVGTAEPDAARVRNLVEVARKAWSVPGVGLAIAGDDKAI